MCQSLLQPGREPVGRLGSEISPTAAPGESARAWTYLVPEFLLQIVFQSPRSESGAMGLSVRVPPRLADESARES